MKQQTNTKQKSWEDYFSNNFVDNILSLKSSIKRKYIKRTILAVAVIWVLWAILILPILLTGRNLVGEEIEITTLFVAGWILLPILVCIFFVIGFNYSNAPREYAEAAEQLISEQLCATDRVSDREHVIGNFELSENVSSKLISVRFWRAVLGFFGIAVALIVITLFVFQ